MTGLKLEITTYSGGQEVLKEAGKMGRFVFGLSEYPGLGADGEAYRALLVAAPQLAELVEDGIPIIEAVLEDREEANGEEDEILRDLLDRFRAMRAVVTGGGRP